MNIARDDQGQALVIVGLAMVVLVCALALSIDWGYSFLMRRGAQTEADAAALGVARMLASTYVGGPVPFEVSQERAWCEAARLRDANVHAAPTAITRTLSISFSADGTTWTTILDVADCTTATTTPVPAGTVLVRASAGATYVSLFGAPARQAVSVQASARAQLVAGAAIRQLPIPTANAGVAGAGLSGATVAPNAAIWPIVRQFDPADFAGLPCGQYCNDSTRLIRLWPDARTLLVTFSHFSPRAGSNVHQLITESDYTGSPNAHHQGHIPNAPMTNADTRACGGSAWDTNGTANLTSAQSCDLPNWFRYGYRGSLSVATNWIPSGSWGSFELSPSPVGMPVDLPPGRRACSIAAYFPAPSCSATPNLLGDWVETVPASIDDVMRDQMRAFIQAYGRQAPNGRGLAVVVNVFLWDCADHYTGGNWTRVADDPSKDCNTAGNPSPDRVHLFTVAPMTVYLSDIRSSGLVRVDAYWGDVFGDSRPCGASPLPATGCALNPLINTAYLVPDE